MLRWLDSLLVTLTGVTTVLGLLPLGARLWWVFDLTTNFRVQYLGAAGVLLVLLVLRRKWLASSALFVIAALNAWPVLPYVPHLTPATAATAAPPVALRLKVMTVNVSYRQFSARRFREVVSQAAPDVLLVVEFTPRAEEILAEFDKVYPQQLKAPAEGPYGIGVWSRFPLQSAFTFPLGPVQGVEARVETPAGVFTLLGSHLVSPTLPRRAEEILAEFDKVYPQQLKAPAEGPYGIGVWSRFPLQSAFTFPLGPVQGVEARVETPAGVFTLLGSHLVSPTLPRRAEQRNEGLDLLAERRAAIAGPVIIAGDFNVTPYSPYYSDWLAKTGLTDSRYGRTLSTSWPAILPILGIPIDHVAVSNEFVILEHDRLPAFGSDHWGIMAELALQPHAAAPGTSP